MPSLPSLSLESAERWAVRLDAGPLSETDVEALTAWLAEDSRHPACLESSRELLARLGDSVNRQAAAKRFPAVSARVRSPVLVRRLVAGFAVAAALVLGAIGWSLRPQVLTTPAAQRSAVLLADGSQVDLNAQTTLSVRLRSNRRDVAMDEGEAYFAVAKDPSRPFVITTGFGAIRVIGTAFNVRSTANDCEVTVVEGTVEVTPSAADAPMTLQAGDQFRWLNGHAFVRRLSDEAAHDAAAWREGRVVFESEPLGTAVARFARFHQRVITVTPEAASIEIGGRFQISELDGFLTDLTLGFPVKVVRLNDDRIIISRP